MNGEPPGGNGKGEVVPISVGADIRAERAAEEEAARQETLKNQLAADDAKHLGGIGEQDTVNAYMSARQYLNTQGPRILKKIEAAARDGIDTIGSVRVSRETVQESLEESNSVSAALGDLFRDRPSETAERAQAIAALENFLKVYIPDDTLRPRVNESRGGEVQLLMPRQKDRKDGE